MVDEVIGTDPVPVLLQVKPTAGHPARVLLAAAEGADLLVLGDRGRGVLLSALLGSIGLQCVLHAPCPVTIVRPDGGTDD
jgi:nucleotide-binding universal stress UspA family protein